MQLQVYLFRWQPPIWQFAIEFRLPRLGRLSIMGTIDVNAEKGEPLPLTTAEIQKIQDRANVITQFSTQKQLLD